MHIGIDGKPLTIAHPCGVKHYAFELLGALSQVDKHNTYTVFLPKYAHLALHNNIHIVISRLHLPWQVSLPILVQNNNVDVFVNIHQHGSIFLKHNNIITIVHDVAPLSSYPPIVEHPYYGLLGRYVLFVREVTLRKSKHLIAISEFTKSELVQYCYDPSVISVVHSGLSSKFLIPQTKKERKYILCMADFSPRKNVRTVIAAYAMLPKNIQQAYKLAIIVSMRHILPKLNALLAYHHIAGKTDIRVSPPLNELIDIYDQSLLFCYPSLYEGFGLPILEAMARECVVVTSDRTATKEVAGNAAIRIDPYSDSALSQAMLRIIQNDSLRRFLVRQSKKRIKEFTWEKTARQFIQTVTSTYEA